MIIIVRIVVAALVILGVWALAKFVIKAIVEKNQCPRCEGKGYWWGTREKVRCDMCFGSGKLKKIREK